MKIFTPYSLREVQLPNRIMMAPMCMYSSENDGIALDWHFVHYVSRAIGGVGLIMLEATAVEPRGRISNRDLGIWNDAQIDGLRRVVEGCKVHGAKIGIQLAHAGRKANLAEDTPVAPSPIAFSEKYQTPTELSKADIDTIVEAFIQGAIRADKAGFDIVEIHGAHGYLIHEFLSPISNKRQDEYGGTLENRVRFLREVIKGIRDVWPQHKPIFLRVSAKDYKDDGIDIQDMIKIINLVKNDGIDLVDVSSGALVMADIPQYPGYQIKLSEDIKRECGIPTGAVGLITTAELAEETLSNDRADIVIIGRELLRNPHWPMVVAKELGVEIPWPKQYERAKK